MISSEMWECLNVTAHGLAGQLPELLSTLQETCVEASDAIARRYFQYQSPVAWERDG